MFNIITAMNYGSYGQNLYLGLSYGGGKIGYIYQPGDPGYIAGQQHGIIVSNSDVSINNPGQPNKAPWQNDTPFDNISTVQTMGQGRANTELIVSTIGTPDAVTYAAKACYDFSDGGFTDWALPSLNDMAAIIPNQAIWGPFDAAGYYWTSSHNNQSLAWAWYFSSPSGDPNIGKGSYNFVRAIRYF